MGNKKNQINYHLMLFPGIIILIIFSIIPMFGIIMAFQNYIPAKGIFGSKLVGLDNFKYMFSLPDSMEIFSNTIIIAVLKIIAGMIIPVIIALLLNEVRVVKFKKTVQTIIYLPHFLSWVILASVVMNIFSFDGPINQLTHIFGASPIMFLASNTWFRPILIITDVWKEFGFSTVIYLAALTGVDPGLYEATAIDGANRFKQLLHITIPCIAPTIILMATLSLGNVLNAGFDQVFNLYNPLVYKTADIIDTYVYRVGLVQLQWSFGTAVGLLKSVVSFLLIIISYKLADKYANYRIF
ncbi:MAG TPA: ABC transporter permease subunit [Clostridiaceae bacterium]